MNFFNWILEGFEVIMQWLPLPKTKRTNFLLAILCFGGSVVAAVFAFQRLEHHPYFLIGLFLFLLICSIQYFIQMLHLQTQKALPGRHRRQK